MTAATKKTQESTGEVDFNQLSPEALMKPYEAWQRSAERVQEELMKFWDKRLREDMELPARLAECSNASEVIAQQVSFATTMFNDYTEENLKLLEIACDSAAEAEHQAEAAITGPLNT